MEVFSGFFFGAALAFFALYLADPLGNWLARFFGALASDLRKRDLTLQVKNLNRAVAALTQNNHRLRELIDAYREAEYEAALAKWKRFMSLPPDSYHTPVNVDLYAKLKELWKDDRELIKWPFPIVAICRCHFEVAMDTDPLVRIRLLEKNIVLEHNGREGDVRTYRTETCPKCQ